MRTLLAALIFVAASTSTYAATPSYNNPNIIEATFKIKHKLQPKKATKCKTKCKKAPVKKIKKKA
jgi:hypothetical protein